MRRVNAHKPLVRISTLCLNSVSREAGGMASVTSTINIVSQPEKRYVAGLLPISGETAGEKLPSSYGQAPLLNTVLLLLDELQRTLPARGGPRRLLFSLPRYRRGHGHAKKNSSIAMDSIVPNFSCMKFFARSC